MNDRPLTSVDARSSKWKELPWPSVSELARVPPPSSWTLVDGLMVKLHAELAELPAPRTTVDVDSALHLETQAITAACCSNAWNSSGSSDYLCPIAKVSLYTFWTG